MGGIFRFQKVFIVLSVLMVSSTLIHFGIVISISTTHWQSGILRPV